MPIKSLGTIDLSFVAFLYHEKSLSQIFMNAINSTYLDLLYLLLTFGIFYFLNNDSKKNICTVSTLSFKRNLYVWYKCPSKLCGRKWSELYQEFHLINPLLPTCSTPSILSLSVLLHSLSFPLSLYVSLNKNNKVYIFRLDYALLFMHFMCLLFCTYFLMCCSSSGPWGQP